MTRLCVFAIALLASLAAAQDKSREQTSYMYDVNGNRTPAVSVGQVSTNGRTGITEKMQTINGRSVPLETVEENVISESDGTKVTERVIRRFDQTGNPLPAEKIRLEQRQIASGSVSTSTVYRADMNGRFNIAERSTTDSTKAGDGLKSTTLVERPGIGGSLETAEKKEAVEAVRSDGSAKDVVTWRKDASGRFYEAVRETSDTVRRGDHISSTVTQYNATNTEKLEFAGQSIAEIQKNSDGSETRVVNIYGAAPPGRSVSQAEQQAFLKEQQVTERRKRQDGSTVDVFGIRRASITDSRLGDYHVVSEVVCKGNCEDTAESAPAQQPGKR